MTLLDRIAAQESCAVRGCEGHREQDSLFCSSHLADMWANRLDREADGTFTYGPRWRTRLAGRDETGAVTR